MLLYHRPNQLLPDQKRPQRMLILLISCQETPQICQFGVNHMDLPEFVQLQLKMQ